MWWPLSVGKWRPLVRSLPSPRHVALTFDDGPTPETTPHLLRLLADAQARATFFFSGIRASAYRELVAETVAAGHAVYGHGWEHVNLEGDPARAVADMCRVEDELSRHRPTPSTYMLRLPYNAGYSSARFHRAMGAFHPGFQFAWWSHSTSDWLIPGRCVTAADIPHHCGIATELLRASSRMAGGIVLMHEQPFDIPSPFNAQVSVTLAGQVLRMVAEEGLACVLLKPAVAANPLKRWILAPQAATAGVGPDNGLASAAS